MEFTFEKKDIDTIRELKRGVEAYIAKGKIEIYKKHSSRISVKVSPDIDIECNGLFFTIFQHGNCEFTAWDFVTGEPIKIFKGEME